MPLEHQLADWSRFPGLYPAVVAALPAPEKITVRDAQPSARSGDPDDWPPRPSEPQFLVATVELLIPVSEIRRFADGRTEPPHA